MVGIAIGVVLLPELSRALKASYQREAMHSQNRALEFAMFLTLPAATALAIISVVVVRVLYERGAFGPETTETTARALAVFALGLPAFVMIKVFTPGYFTREDTKTPMLFAGISVAVNIAMALTLFPHIPKPVLPPRNPLRPGSMPLLFPPSNAAATFRLIRRAGETCRALVCCAIMAAALFGGIHVLRPYFQPEAGILYQVGSLMLLMSVDGIVYFVAAGLTGAMSMRALLANLRRKPAA